MAEVFICPKGSISDRSIRALREAGVVVVQAADPSKCKFLRAGEEISGSDMLFAALRAVHQTGTSREAFTGALIELMKAARTPIAEADK